MRHQLCVLFLLALASLLSSCSSTRPGGAHLYVAGDSATLLDGEIRLESYQPRTPGKAFETRSLVMRDGQLEGRIDKARYVGEAELPFELWADLWNRVRRDGALEWEIEAPDPSGGVFHIVTLSLGPKLRQFSAQYKTNFLGTVTADVTERQELVNEIAKRSNELIPTRVRETESEQGDPPPSD